MQMQKKTMVNMMIADNRANYMKLLSENIPFHDHERPAQTNALSLSMIAVQKSQNLSTLRNDLIKMFEKSKSQKK